LAAHKITPCLIVLVLVLVLVLEIRILKGPRDEYEDDDDKICTL